MLSPGILIAIDVALLYLVMGPLVLFGIYVLFDSLGRKREGELPRAGKKGKKDPALWCGEDIPL